jgi:thioredoxin 1/putative thioredoxin
MLSQSTVTKVTEATFEREVLQSELPVLIDLYADWCAPCRTLAPRVEAVAREYAGRLKVVKINTDESPRIAQAFRVQSIPMLVLIVDGRPAGVLRGAVPKEEIVALVEQAVGGSEGAGGISNVKAPELAKLIQARQVLVVDVREAGPFARAHIPSAMHVPVDQLESKLPQLAIYRRPVIVYDRSNGDDAKRAVEIFAKQNFPAAALEGGILAWESEGLEIERAN